MSGDTKAFEGWAIVELMGHVRLAGYVTEVEIAGQGFLRLDVAERTDGDVVWPAATQFSAPDAVYRLTPCTEEAAALVRSHAEPVTRWEVPQLAIPIRVGESLRVDEPENDGPGF